MAATLSNHGWPDGHDIPVPQVSPGSWREIFSSDWREYGGQGVVNPDELQPQDGKLKLRLPARGFVVVRHVPR